jgi:glycosyltransferase involved in cell wall biosynthesis
MISVAMGYRNRKQLLIRTLDSIRKSLVKDYEVVIVDDASDDEHRIEDIIPLYPEIKFHRFEPEEKHWFNPCIAYNKAFEMCSNKIIVIQNPECFHHGDVLSAALENVTRSNYVLLPVYALNKEETEIDFESIANKSKEDILKYLQPAPWSGVEGSSGWYNHSVYNRRGLHFCSAIHKSSLNLLKGFDERFAFGYSFEDDEFINRIIMNGYKLQFLDEPVVFHQWHYSSHITNNPKFYELFVENRDLLNKIKNRQLPFWGSYENI